MKYKRRVLVAVTGTAATVKNGNIQSASEILN